MKDAPVEKSVERPLPEREGKQIALDQWKTFVDKVPCGTEGFEDIIHSHHTTAMTLQDGQIPSLSARSPACLAGSAEEISRSSLMN